MAYAVEQSVVGESTVDGEMVTYTSGLTSGTDYDVRLEAGVGVSGEVTASRRFAAQPGSRSVSVRYRFASSEVFWSQPKPDYYRVTLTNHATGAVVQEVRTVAELTFDASGASAWRSLSIAAEEGQSVTASFAVANAEDTKYPSILDVDSIAERVFRGFGSLTEPYRRRVPNTAPARYVVYDDPLNYLSAAPHNYGAPSGYTIVNGNLRFFGQSDEQLTSVVLEIGRNNLPSSKIAEGRLTTAASAALLNRSLDSFGGVFASGPVFEIDAWQFAVVTEDLLYLAVVARTQMGHTIRLPMGTVFRWSHFSPEDGPKRYGNRDPTNCFGTTEPCNGDAWSFPRVIDFMDWMTPAWFAVNDFSNMNGGWFKGHASHQDGLDIDAYFSGYERRTAAVADALLAFLKANLSKVQLIWVTLTPEMRVRLAAEPALADGRQARNVILNETDYEGHFHIRLKSRNPQ